MLSVKSMLQKGMSSIKVTPLGMLYAFILALFPLVSTVLGDSSKIGDLQVWKMLWLAWLGVAGVCMARRQGFFSFKLDRAEIAFWFYIAFMLVFAPKADLVIDPWKIFFFSSFSLFAVRLMRVADGKEIQAMILASFCLWWGYLSFLVVYVLRFPFYPGCTQHQFFLSGVLGFIAGLLLVLKGKTKQEIGGKARWVYGLLLFSALINLGVNIEITKTRSIFPFSLVLILVGASWLLKNTTQSVPSFARRLGLPLVLIVSLLPFFHLSGAMGNWVNEVTYPLFGKLRTIESGTGREVVFQRWGRFVLDYAHVLGPVGRDLPAIMQEKEDPNISSTPLFGLSKEEQDVVREKGREAQKFFLQVQDNLGAEKDNKESSPQEVKADVVHEVKKDSTPEAGKDAIPLEKSLATSSSNLEEEQKVAITSSHNLWLDSAARSGFLYAAAIALGFLYVAWLLSNPLAMGLPIIVGLAYWGMAVAWGFASQFDDEHWLYHIPYLTFFFLPVLVVSFESRYRKI